MLLRLHYAGEYTSVLDLCTRYMFIAVEWTGDTTTEEMEQTMPSGQGPVLREKFSPKTTGQYALLCPSFPLERIGDPRACATCILN